MAQRTCRITGKVFQLSAAYYNHLTRLSEANSYLRAPIPSPTVHPLEELRRQWSFANYINIFRGVSAISGTPQLSRYDPKFGTKISTLDEYWEERVDNSVFGRDYDFSRPFFTQWSELAADCIFLPFNNFQVEDSEYVNGAYAVKGCYLSFNVLNSEDCLYCLSCFGSRDCLDCVWISGCELCYSSVNLRNCYACQECIDCQNCNGCLLSENLIGCSNCFGCVGLRNCSYALFNEVVSRERYIQFLNGLKLTSRSSREELRAKAADFIASHHLPAERLINTENSSGDYLAAAKNSEQCFLSENLEDCGFLVQSGRAKDCWQGFAIDSSLAYKSMPIRAYNDLFSYISDRCTNLVYCYFLSKHCDYCFGSVGLQGKSYCILNKQYSKEQYFELVPRIVGQMIQNKEWGEWFPPRLSQHAYINSVAGLIFQPISTEQIKNRGYRLAAEADDLSSADLSAETAADIPDNLEITPDREITGRTFRCAAGGRPFRIQKKELAFYRQQNVPLPDLHWRTRLIALNQRRSLIPAVE